MEPHKKRHFGKNLIVDNHYPKLMLGRGLSRDFFLQGLMIYL